MRRWVVIPVKAPQACKTRLSPALDEQEREALVAAMLRRALDAARAVAGDEHVLLLGPSRHGLDPKTPLLPDAGEGLNAAVTSALDAAKQAKIERLLILSADLPQVRPDDVAAMLNVADDVIAIGPDRAGQGTNALSLPLPAAGDFRFHYGEGSSALHEAEAGRLGASCVRIERPGLALDVDWPGDLAPSATPE